MPGTEYGAIEHVTRFGVVLVAPSMNGDPGTFDVAVEPGVVIEAVPLADDLVRRTQQLTALAETYRRATQRLETVVMVLHEDAVAFDMQARNAISKASAERWEERSRRAIAVAHALERRTIMPLLPEFEDVMRAREDAAIMEGKREDPTRPDR